jgi:hypothetical protein
MMHASLFFIPRVLAVSLTQLDLVVGLLYPQELKVRMEQQQRRLEASPGGPGEGGGPLVAFSADLRNQASHKAREGGEGNVATTSSSDRTEALEAAAVSAIGVSAAPRDDRDGAPRMLSKVPGLEQKLAACTSRYLISTEMI